MKRFGRLASAAAVVVVLGALLVTSSADAQKVSNPGAFSINPTGGYIALGNQLLDLTPKTLAECQDGIDNNDAASGTGDGKIDFVAPAGSVADPQCASAVDNSELIPGVQPLETTSRDFLWKGVDVRVIDGAVNGVARSFAGAANLLRYTQTGSSRNYAAVILIGAIILIGYFGYMATR